MPLFGSRRPNEGDQIATTESIQLHLFEAPLPKNSRGVVTDSNGTFLTVEFDTGWGTIRANVRRSQCRVTRRGVGKERFRRAANVRLSIRLGALVLLALPCINYLWWYWAQYGTFDGVIEDAAIGMVEAAGSTILSALTDPGRTLALAAVGTLTWWLAFGFPRRRRS